MGHFWYTCFWVPPPHPPPLKRRPGGGGGVAGYGHRWGLTGVGSGGGWSLLGSTCDDRIAPDVWRHRPDCLLRGGWGAGGMSEPGPSLTRATDPSPSIPAPKPLKSQKVFPTKLPTDDDVAGPPRHADSRRIAVNWSGMGVTAGTLCRRVYSSSVAAAESSVVRGRVAAVGRHSRTFRCRSATNPSVSVCGGRGVRRGVGSKNRKTTPATASTTPSAPTTGLRERSKGTTRSTARSG